MLDLENSNHKLLFTVLLPVICMILTFIVILILNPENRYWGLFLTIGQLIATLILIFYLKLSRDELGLKYQRSNLSLHLLAILSLIAIVIIVKYILEGVQFVNNEVFDLTYYFIFYLIVAITEEIYFRGVLYQVLKTWSPIIALIGSSIIFGLFHIRSGLTAVIILTVTGLSFAVVRYVSDSIILLIPFHLFFNYQSVLFKFNDSTDISIILFYVLSVSVTIIFVYIKSRMVKSSISM